ncbi:MAG: hypothetical protein II988_03975 [Clostridia bacterium]|nr:hypothetical protein [Clostridia bacterium]
MEKFYGFRINDLRSLAEYLSLNPQTSLNELFNEYSAKTGKARGTVRNLYYALVKLCEKDKEFCNTYFKKSPPKAVKIKAFSAEQEDWLLENVLSKTASGSSVRHAVLELANGDSTLALRYQNKYRSLCALKPQKVKEFTLRMGADDKKTKITDIIPETSLYKLKREINSLVGRVSEKVRKENEYLRARVSFLQAENIRLNSILYGNPNSFVQ